MRLHLQRIVIACALVLGAACAYSQWIVPPLVWSTGVYGQAGPDGILGTFDDLLPGQIGIRSGFAAGLYQSPVSGAFVTADVDMEKVSAVRTAIEQGTYVVDPQAIADKLLANAQELLDRTRN